MEPSWSTATALVFHVSMGVGLAACAGLRAFLPLLVVGVAGRLELVPLSDSFSWLAGWPALIVFGVAVAVELAGDKLPAVDHLLDALQVFVKPVAGALLMASAVHELAPLYVTVFWILAGGTIAGGVHLAKAKLRLVSSVTTAGLGNPGLSVAEDAAALAGTAVSIAAPLLMLLVVATGVTLAWLVLRARARRPSGLQSRP